jgi:hypothetical protein
LQFAYVFNDVLAVQHVPELLLVHPVTGRKGRKSVPPKSVPLLELPSVPTLETRDKSVHTQAFTLNPPSLVFSMASQATKDAANAPDAVVDASAKKLQRRKRFEAVFPLIKQELLDYLDGCKMPRDGRDWFDRVS